MKKVKRVLIAEDSIFIQKILIRILNEDPELEVVGVAKNGKMAVEMARNLKPDVITMDIRMPVMDGFQATRIIMSETPTPILVVSSSVNTEDLKISFNAIQAGALDIMEKPRGHLSGDYYEVGQEIIKKIKLISGIKVFRHLSPAQQKPQPINNDIAKTAASKGVAIGASTGGPSALFQVITSLADNFPAPVFVTLHISEGFGRGCVDWIKRNSNVDVRMAENGEHIKPGTVYFAPEDRIMRIASRNFISVDGEKMSRKSSPINNMMESFSQVYGAEGIGIILTGMGDDGALGLKKIRDSGGRTIAQDKETSVVFGMPKEAIRLDAVERTLPLDMIASQLVAFLRR